MDHETKLDDKVKSILDLKKILKHRNLSVQKLHEMLEGEKGTYSYLSEIVRNEKFPRPDKLLQIAKALDLEVGDLFEKTKETKPNPIEGSPIFKKDQDGNYIEIGYLNMTSEKSLELTTEIEENDQNSGL